MDAGDVVVLKSGGVKMTVNEIGQNGDINCMWYSQCSGRFEVQTFNSSVLRKFDENVNSIPGSKK